MHGYRISGVRFRLERWFGLAIGRSRLGSNPTAENLSLQNFGNSVYPLSQCLSEETLKAVGPL